MFGGFTGIGEDPSLIQNPFTGEMVHANDPEGKALQAAMASDSYKQNALPNGPYGSLGMSPETGYYHTQNQMRDLANQMSTAGFSDYGQYKNVTPNDLYAAKQAGSTWTPDPAPDYSKLGGTASEFTPDQLSAMKYYAPGYYAQVTGSAAPNTASSTAPSEEEVDDEMPIKGRKVKKADGGLASLPEYKAGGLLHGPGDGMSDSIPAVIKGEQPQRAALADGEFVVPADVVSHLGNGSTKAGSARLYEMMDRIRQARTGNPKQGKKINPHKFLPV
jgi:hypothetical protein